jgi:hypothetical protein
VLGSVANLIVVENARREGVTVSFWEYCKVGVPLTILTLALGIAWFLFVHYFQVLSVPWSRKDKATLILASSSL